MELKDFGINRDLPDTGEQYTTRISQYVQAFLMAYILTNFASGILIGQFIFVGTDFFSNWGFSRTEQVMTVFGTSLHVWIVMALHRGDQRWHVRLMYAVVLPVVFAFLFLAMFVLPGPLVSMYIFMRDLTLPFICFGLALYVSPYSWLFSDITKE